VSPKQIFALAAAILAVGAAVASIAFNVMQQEKRTQGPRREVTKQIQKAQPEKSQAETVEEEEEQIEEELLPLLNPYYIGTISILQTITTNYRGQIIYYSFTDLAYDSEELLVYDDKTKKCYIMGRRLTYKSSHNMEKFHTGVGITMAGDGESYGETAEKYGRNWEISSSGYLTSEGIADYSSFPVRADVEKGIIYTLIPTKEHMWVDVRMVDEISTSPPIAFAQETIYNEQVERIPVIAQIYISEIIIPDTMNLGINMSVEGTFVFNIRQATLDEARQFGTELTEEIAIRQERGELAPDLEVNIPNQKEEPSREIPLLPSLPPDFDRVIPPLPSLPDGMLPELMPKIPPGN